ncbi:YceI family protein [Aureibaculum marinum]|uniref:YceI family protein n=1 Tax=Aureibaculum marinum TaxID=2487930 RepID=A0A3N4NUY9_9FLAO|nr:YceI family protein [Aureibaculum marinum]RPD99984.1 YceI family protein [Aureibaculum marinum]
MILSRFILLSLYVLTFSFTNTDSVIGKTSVVITPDSSFSLKGSSNVNSFSCTFNVEKINNPIDVTYHVYGDKISFSNTKLVLDNSYFDCGHNKINDDLNELLKSEKYPKIFIYLKEFSSDKNESKVNTIIDIEIAGIRKTYNIPIQVDNSNNNMQISGNLNVNLSDYKLQAPKKLFGLIRVEDTIEINFNLSVRED